MEIVNKMHCISMKIHRKWQNQGDLMAVWNKYAPKQNSTTNACFRPPQIVVHKEQLFASRWKRLRFLFIQNIPHLEKSLYD